MKFKAYYILFAFALLFSAPSFAQVDRSVGQSQYRRPKKKGKPADFVEVTVEYYTKQLKLDDFQIAAVKEILEDQRNSITELGAEHDITDNEKKDRANAINEKIDSRIKPLLNAEQLKKYEELQEKRKNRT